VSEHDDLQHGSAPLPRVDPADLHAVVDALAQTLHSYVDTAVGVRAEFGAAEADEDPRVLALEARTGSLNAQLYDLLHTRPAPWSTPSTSASSWVRRRPRAT